MSDQESPQLLFPTAFNIVFKEGDTLNSVCSRLAGYNTERYEAVALRFYSGDETFITVFAHDKLKVTQPESEKVTLPVHKFKLLCSLESFFKEIQQLNFTVTNNEFVIDDMEVLNK